MAANSPIASAVNQAINQGIAGGSAAATPLLDDLVAYWDLSEASGQRNDSHTNAYHLTDVNTVASRTGVGGTGTAADFTAAFSERLTKTSEAGLQVADKAWNAVLWAYRDLTGTISLMAKGHPSVAGGEYNLIGTGTDSLFWMVRKADDTGLVQVGTSGLLPTGSWRFISFGHDPDANQIFLQVNNGTKSTAAVPAGVVTSSKVFEFGSRNNGGDFFDGGAQAGGIWERLLTADELTWLYNSGTAARLYADVRTYTG